jgi:hypothetical protein
MGRAASANKLNTYRKAVLAFNSISLTIRFSLGLVSIYS